MKDLLELIHTNAHNAYEIGVRTEKERNMRLAANRICFDNKTGCEHAACYALRDLIELIRVDTK